MKKKLASIFSKFEIEFCKKTILEMQFDVTLKKTKFVLNLRKFWSRIHEKSYCFDLFATFLWGIFFLVRDFTFYRYRIIIGSAKLIY